jgi:acyl-CoA reductase-like NAD-dependent aldehyde dehydrogenase
MLTPRRLTLPPATVVAPADALPAAVEAAMRRALAGQPRLTPQDRARTTRMIVEAVARRLQGRDGYGR